MRLFFTFRLFSEINPSSPWPPARCCCAAQPSCAALGSGEERQGAALHSCCIRVTGVQARHAGNGGRWCGGVCRGGACVEQGRRGMRRAADAAARSNVRWARGCGSGKGAGAAIEQGGRLQRRPRWSACPAWRRGLGQGAAAARCAWQRTRWRQPQVGHAVMVHTALAGKTNARAKQMQPRRCSVCCRLQRNPCKQCLLF
jgi:hypothetical protein